MDLCRGQVGGRGLAQGQFIIGLGIRQTADSGIMDGLGLEALHEGHLAFDGRADLVAIEDRGLGDLITGDVLGLQLGGQLAHQG